MLKSFLYAVLKVYIYIRSDWYEPVTFFVAKHTTKRSGGPFLVYRKSHFLLYKNAEAFLYYFFWHTSKNSCTIGESFFSFFQINTICVIRVGSSIS